jgi:brefeldin A-resistance guanine nucleotide exchange factor 1
MLLVMSNGGYLAPPDENPAQEELWNETWKRVNRFLPNFFAELFPEEAGKPKRSKELPIREKATDEVKPVTDEVKTEDVVEEEEEEDEEKVEAKEG